MRDRAWIWSVMVLTEEENGDAEIPSYRLQVKFQQNLGTEIEGNDTPGTATPLVGSDVFIYGNHATLTDSDYYAITLPAPGGSLRAEIIEGVSKTCESNDMDSEITLYDANLQLVADDDDDGRGFCSRIDGTGAQVQQDTQASNLPAGTYFILVKSHNTLNLTRNIFDYRLVVRYERPDIYLKDDFDNDLGKWSAVSADGGDLWLNPEAGLGGVKGLEAVVDDTNPLFVEDDRPMDDGRYRVDFLLDPFDFDPGMAQGHQRARIFIAFEEAPTRRLVAVVLKRQGAQYSLMSRVRRDDGTLADTGFFNIGPGTHRVECEWKRATSPSSADGEFRMWIDEDLVSESTNLQIYTSSVDFARLGAMSLKAGTSGRLRFDDFESRRYTYIGYWYGEPSGAVREGTER